MTKLKKIYYIESKQHGKSGGLVQFAIEYAWNWRKYSIAQYFMDQCWEIKKHHRLKSECSSINENLKSMSKNIYEIEQAMSTYIRN